MNAKIMASGIGSAGTDFLDYVGEVGRSLKLARTHLELFRDDLNRVNNQLHDATSSEAEFNKRYSATMTVVPRQLSDNLDIYRHPRRVCRGDSRRRQRQIVTFATASPHRHGPAVRRHHTPVHGACPAQLPTDMLVAGGAQEQGSGS
jgi:hypothetical protein